MSLGTFNDIVIVSNTEIVFDLVDQTSILGFGYGICKQLLASSKALRKSRKLSPKK